MALLHGFTAFYGVLRRFCRVLRGVYVVFAWFYSDFEWFNMVSNGLTWLLDGFQLFFLQGLGVPGGLTR